MTQEPNPKSPPAATDREAAPDSAPISPRRALFGVGIVLIVLLVLAAVGILHRLHADNVLAARTNSLAPPTVSVAPATRGASVESLVLPGNVTALTDSPIYARTDGYLDRWYFDIGSKVKKGQLLAEISTPELDKQVSQAESDLATAQATATNARTQADRYSGLVKSDAVSQQDTDTFVNQAAATASTVKSAEANLQRLRELQSFEKVYAPFDGVVTAREVDTGQLISSGSGQGAGTELFHMQALQTLRVYTNVPQLFSQTMKVGMKVGLTFPEYAGITFQGTLVRTANAIDPVSRTLLVELDVDNRSGQLMPGALAQVHFKTTAATPTFNVPASALIFRRGGEMQLAIVTDSSDGAIAHLISVGIGEDDGATVQIVTGLNPNDKVIQDPPDSLIDGEKVTVESSESSAFGSGGL
jgi:RND family efflux transporter MFP subunit